MRRWPFMLALPVVILPFACHTETLDVGGAGGGADAAADGPGQSGPEVWTGYLEGFQFPSGSDHVTLTFIEDDASGVRGSLFLGDPPALPPPTNPEVGYPPGLVPTDRPPPTPLVDQPMEKFAFTLLDAKRSGARVTFHIAVAEVFKAWCELQNVIYPVVNGTAASAPDGGQVTIDGGLIGWGCLPNAATGAHAVVGDAGNTEFECYWSDPFDAAVHPVDCGKLFLCGPAGQAGGFGCACSPTACSVDIAHAAANWAFDGQLDQSSSTGTGTLFGHTARLTRQRP